MRRSFLEKLIEHCDQRIKWTDGCTDWSGVIEELTRRREDVETTSTPRLTKWGIAGAASLLIAPVALQLYQKIHFEWHPYWEGFALCMSALPLIVAIMLIVSWYVEEHHKPEAKRKPLPSLIFTSAENKITTKTSKTPDPTSVEFEKYYCDLLKESLGNNERRLVIVVDNLDRIDHDDARSIWATLRVFFDSSTDSSADWHQRVWVLVPFDPEAINDLWQSSEYDAAKPAIAKHFLEKTFQATFRVPPIILSNWENYLLAQLRIAFPKHTSGEFHLIFRIYDRLAVAGAVTPTPRNLKIFANGVGALHRQWQDRIPLVQQAAFVLIADRPPDEILNILRSTEVVVRNSVQNVLNVLLEIGWQRNLSALYFNVEPEQAYQILLAQPIYKAMQSGDGEALAALENNPGFLEVLEAIVEIPFTNSPPEAETVAHMATAFSALAGNTNKYSRCRAHLFQTSLSFNEWVPFNSDIASGIKHILDMAPDGSDRAPIMRSVRNSLKPLNTDAQLLNSADWCAGIAIVIPEFARQNEALLEREMHVRATAPQYLTFINDLHRTSLESSFWKFLQPSIPKDDVLTLLAQKAREGMWSEETAEDVSALIQIGDGWNWSVLVSGLQDRISDHPTPLPADVQAVLRTLFGLSVMFPEARTFLENAAAGESLLQILSLSQSSATIDAMTFCILPLLTSNVQVNQPVIGYGPNTPQLRAQSGRQVLLGYLQSQDSNPPLIETLAATCMSWLSLDKWRVLSQENPEKALLIEKFLGVKIAEEHELIDSSELVGNLEYWRNTLGGDDLNAILLERATSGDLSLCLSSRPFNLIHADLYRLALDHWAGEGFARTLISSLYGCTKEDWQSALISQSSVIGLALALKEDHSHLGLPFQDALYWHLEQLLQGTAVGESRFDWTRVVELLGDNYLTAFKQQLLGRFKNADGPLGIVIAYYGETLATTVVEDGPDKSFDTIRLIIERHQESEVKWVATPPPEEERPAQSPL